MKYDPHGYAKQLERNKELVRKDNRVSKRNKNFLFDFIDDRIASGIGVARISRCISCLRQLCVHLKKDLDKADIKDMKRVITIIETNPRYAHWTKFTHKVIIKQFYSWLRECKPKHYPPEVDWIKLQVKNKTRLPQDMLTEEDVKKLIDNSNRIMTKALIAVLYESGCRIGEILSLQVKNISSDRYGAILMVDGKTGQRRVRIIASWIFLKRWINDHPNKDDPEAPIWINYLNTQLSHSYTLRLIKNAKNKAGIKKRCNPHTFRHSRATFMANHLTEAQMKEYFGWTQGSRMASVYVHISGRDVDKALLRIHGINIDKKDKKESVFIPKKCSNCDQPNAPVNKYCQCCGLVLDSTERVKIIKYETQRKTADEAMDRLMGNPEFKQKFMEMVTTFSRGGFS